MTLTAWIYALAYAAASTYGIVLLWKMARRDAQQEMSSEWQSRQVPEERLHRLMKGEGRNR